LKLIGYFILSCALFIFGYIVYIDTFSYNSFKRLHQYDSPLTTQIFDKNDKLIANVFKDQHRIYVNFDEIPIGVIEALVAIEDTEFFDHNGINIDAILRAIIKDIKAMAFVEGASTITQQLVKTKFLSRDKKIKRKIKEIILSVRLEKTISKSKILELYLNEIYFAHGYYGILTASLGYFKKPLNALSLKEIAMLIGIPKSPNSFSPTKHYERNLIRANKVIKRLKVLKWIDDIAYHEALSQRPKVYDESLSLNKAPYVVDYVNKILQKDLVNFRQNGYKVYTHIDLNIQSIARESLRYGHQKILEKNIQLYLQEGNKSNLKADSNQHFIADNNESNITQLTYEGKLLNGSISVMNPSTGNILALVGGIDYKKSSFNRASQAIRQVGSSAKPFIYQVALNSGYGLKSNLKDITRRYEYVNDDGNLTWKPRNYSSAISGLLALDASLIYSRNLATINLVEDLGLDYVYNKMKDFNISGLPYDLSLSLGSFGASSLKMQKYYSLFSNYGVMVEPNIISRIENKRGETIRYESKKVYKMPPSQAYLITNTLQKTIKRGTGKRARVRGIELAGKTGTTNNNIDVWFCGYSPSIQTIVWYGSDDSSSLGKKSTGGGSAAPVFGYFYKKLLKLYPHTKRKFDIPEDVFFDHQNIPYTQISNSHNTKKAKSEKLFF